MTMIWRVVVLAAFGLLLGVRLLPEPSGSSALAGSAPAVPADVMRLGDVVPAGAEALRRLNAAIAERSMSGAVRAWQEAYGVALGSRRWEDMIAVGDAAVHVGELEGLRTRFIENARQSYLIAFVRARQLQSVDGLVRAGEAFATLDDHAVVEHCVRVAGRLVGSHGSQDEKIRERLARLENRLATARKTI